MGLESLESGLEMTDIATEYGIPAELMRFVDNGMLDVVSTDPDDKKTVHFTVPSLRSADDQNRVTIYSVIWIHPAINAQFCHYFHETPGDLANFLRQSRDDGIG